MKMMKKFASLLLALAMIFSLSLTAFADDEQISVATATITVEDNRVYEVYQIFTGELSDGGKLSNVKWGENAVLPENAKVGDLVDQGVVKSLEGQADDATVIARISPYVNFGSDAVAQVSKDKSVTVPVGYYLLKDVTKLTEGQEHSRYVITLVDDVNVASKAASVTAEKHVKDRNDTTNDTSNWQDAADYDIGDNVPFELIAFVSSTYGYYNSYTLTFHDKLSAGLTFLPETVKVSDGEDVVDGAYYEVVTNCDDGCSFHIEIPNLKNIPGVAANAKIYVNYEAVLNENAVIGSAGNPNEMYLEYSNDPANEDSVGQTPVDKVKVFTYQLKVNKVDENKAPLKGAGFTLFKEIPDNGVTTEVAVGEEITGEDLTEFVWKGLDDGTYVLKETTTPEGYNTLIAPIRFVVDAKHDMHADDPQLTELKGGTLGTGDIASGELTTEVVNRAGTVLPSTGGMGTTLIYALGGILVVVAVVLLITKKRMANAE